MAISTVLWLAGLAATMAGAGLSLYYQGRILEAPKQQAIIAKRCKIWGIALSLMALAYAILAVISISSSCIP